LEVHQIASLMSLSGVKRTCLFALWRVHDLRRTCRTGLSKLRIAPHVAEAVLGYAAPAIVRIYDVHDLADEKRHALEAWAGLVQRIISDEDNVVALRR
jgi:hypothetical protein